jgi:hypothetical protein
MGVVWLLVWWRKTLWMWTQQRTLAKSFQHLSWTTSAAAAGAMRAIGVQAAAAAAQRLRRSQMPVLQRCVLS